MQYSGLTAEGGGTHIDFHFGARTRPPQCALNRTCASCSVTHIFLLKNCATPPRSPSRCGRELLLYSRNSPRPPQCALHIQPKSTFLSDGAFLVTFFVLHVHTYCVALTSVIIVLFVLNATSPSILAPDVSRKFRHERWRNLCQITA